MPANSMQCPHPELGPGLGAFAPFLYIHIHLVCGARADNVKWKRSSPVRFKNPDWKPAQGTPEHSTDIINLNPFFLLLFAVLSLFCFAFFRFTFACNQKLIKC